MTHGSIVLNRGERIASGFYEPDVFRVNKFGINTAVGTTEEDIWAAGGKETLLTSGATMYVSCEDNVNGVGQTIQVDGLDANWNRVVGIAVLTGQTQAPITNLDGSALTMTRVNRAFQISAEPDPVGDIWVAESDTLTGGVPDTSTKVHAFVNYTDAAQQTQKAMYTVPAGYECLVHKISAALVGASGGSARSCGVVLEVQGLASGATVATPTWAPFRRIGEINVSTNGPHDERDYDFPLHVGQLSNLHLRGVATATLSLIAQMQLVLYKTP